MLSTRQLSVNTARLAPGVHCGPQVTSGPHADADCGGDRNLCARVPAGRHPALVPALRYTWLLSSLALIR